jgi:hypothetical protein
MCSCPDPRNSGGPSRGMECPRLIVDSGDSSATLRAAVELTTAAFLEGVGGLRAQRALSLMAGGPIERRGR